MSDVPEMEKKSNKGSPVFIYLAILFAAAFVMLLMAYFMQVRNSEETIDSLQTSINSIEALNDMIDKNRELENQMTDLEKQLEESKAETTTAQTETATVQQQANAYKSQMEFVTNLLLVENMLEAQDYGTAAQLCVKMAGNVPTAPIQGDGAFDAKAHFDSLVAQLVEGGYLVQAEDGTLSAVQVQEPTQ